MFCTRSGPDSCIISCSRVLRDGVGLPMRDRRLRRRTGVSRCCGSCTMVENDGLELEVVGVVDNDDEADVDRERGDEEVEEVSSSTLGLEARSIDDGSASSSGSSIYRWRRW